MTGECQCGKPLYAKGLCNSCYQRSRHIPKPARPKVQSVLCKCGLPKVRTASGRWVCRPCSRRRDRERFEQRREYNRLAALTWAAEHRDLAAQRAREWYEAHHDQAAAASRGWRLRHPMVVKAMGMKRRARIAEAVCQHGPACITPEFLVMVYAACCIYCGQPAAHADHFISIAAGGLHCQENLVPACVRCNESKGRRDPFEWIRSSTFRGDPDRMVP